MITTVTFCTGQSSHSSPILSRSFDERIRMSKRYFGGDSMWNVTMINFLRKSISPGPIQGLTMSCRQDLEEIKVQVLPESAFALEGEMIFHHRLILHEKLIWNKSWANLERVLWLSKRFRKDQPIISLNFPSLWSILLLSPIPPRLFGPSTPSSPPVNWGSANQTDLYSMRTSASLRKE